MVENYRRKHQCLWIFWVQQKENSWIPVIIANKYNSILIGVRTKIFPLFYSIVQQFSSRWPLPDTTKQLCMCEIIRRFSLLKSAKILHHSDWDCVIMRQVSLLLWFTSFVTVLSPNPFLFLYLFLFYSGFLSLIKVLTTSPEEAICNCGRNVEIIKMLSLWQVQFVGSTILNWLCVKRYLIKLRELNFWVLWYMQCILAIFLNDSKCEYWSV